MALKFLFLQCCWALAITSSLIFFFRGFLSLKVTLTNESKCDSPPIGITLRNSTSCWNEPRYRRVVLFVVDGLRFDFVAPSSKTGPYLNHFPVVAKLLKEDEGKEYRHSFLYHFKADPPTLSLQRFKCMATGTLPSFVEVLKSVEGTEVKLDSWLTQFSKKGGRAVVTGDETWQNLFPSVFKESHKFYGMNLHLHVVDQGVKSKIPAYIDAPLPTNKQELLVGYFLGVDHCGHLHGPSDPLMTKKLEEISAFIEEMIEKVDKQPETLLVLIGDHGMTMKGEHGSNSDLETGSAFFIYSSKGIYRSRLVEDIESQLGRRWWNPQDDVHEDCMDKVFKEYDSTLWRSIPQIDMAPTLSLLLGLPIPFQSLGMIVPELLAVTETDGDNKNLDKDAESIRSITEALRLNTHQIFRYLDAYNLISPNHLKNLDIWKRVMRIGDSHYSNKNMIEAYLHYSKANRLALNGCRGTWSNFDFSSLWVGALTCMAWLILWVAFKERVGALLVGIILGITVWTLSYNQSWNVVFFTNNVTQWEFLPLMVTLGMLLAMCFCCKYQFRSMTWWPNHWELRHINEGICILSIFLQISGYEGSSFIKYEQDVLMGLIQTQFMGYLLQLLVSLYHSNDVENSPSSLQPLRQAQKSLLLYTALNMILVRISGAHSACRPDQFRCENTLTEDTFNLSLYVMLPLIIPTLMKRSLAPAVTELIQRFWNNYGFSAVLMCSCLFWTLSEMVQLKHYFARFLYFLCISMFLHWLWKPITLRASSTSSSFRLDTSWWALLTVIYAYFFITLQPAAALVFTCCLVQIWSFIKLTAISEAHQHCFESFLQQRQQRTSIQQQHDESTPTRGLSFHTLVCYSQIALHYFFRTGHQAVLSSIQWKVAFIGVEEMNYLLSPWLIISNTLGSFLLFATGLPLVVILGTSAHQHKIMAINAQVRKAIFQTLYYWFFLQLFSMLGVIKYHWHSEVYFAWGPRAMLGAMIIVVLDLWLMLVVSPCFLRLISSAQINNKTTYLKS